MTTLRFTFIFPKHVRLPLVAQQESQNNVYKTIALGKNNLEQTLLHFENIEMIFKELKCI